MEQNQEKRFALLIDADNIGSQYVRAILEEITGEGIVTYKRIYGDWTSPSLKPWKEVLLEYSITPMQQYSYTSGKNATDSAMIIDAMDILYSGKVDGFCLASSDSDFTRLAVRLREAGMTVVGMGKKQTPRAFVSACSKFKYIDIISEEIEKTAQKDKEQAAEKAPAPDTGKKSASTKTGKDESSQTPMQEVKTAIARMIDENAVEDGFVLVSQIGNLLQKKYPDFDPKNYGFKKMMDLLEAWGFEIRKTQDKNNGANPGGFILYVRLSNDRKIGEKLQKDENKAQKTGKKRK